MANGKSRKCICLRQQGLPPLPSWLGRPWGGRRRDGIIRTIKEETTHFVIFQPQPLGLHLAFWQDTTNPKASGANQGPDVWDRVGGEKSRGTSRFPELLGKLGATRKAGGQRETREKCRRKRAISKELSLGFVAKRAF